MTFRILESPLSNVGVRVSEDKGFDEIITLPKDSDQDTLQNFITLKQLHYNPATHTSSTDVLLSVEKLSFEANFYIDMESANRANVRSIRFQIFIKDPTTKVSTAFQSPVGSKGHANESFIDTMTGGFGVSGGKFSAAITANKSVGGSTIIGQDISTIGNKDFGMIKEFFVPTGVTDDTITIVRKAINSETSSPRPTFETKSIEKSLVDAKLTQTYSAIVTPKILIEKSALPTDPVDGKVGTKNIASQTNTISSTILKSEKTATSSQTLAKNTLFKEKTDPTAHLNFFYSASSTAKSSGTSSTSKAVSFDNNKTSLGKNEVKVTKSGTTPNGSLQKIVTDTKQSSVTQKFVNVSAKPNLSALFVNEASISVEAASNSAVQKIESRSISFTSSLIQHKSEFDIDAFKLKPHQVNEIYVRVDLLDKDDREYKFRIIRVDFRKQLASMVTPQVPPQIKIVRQDVGNVVLSIEQKDPLAIEASIYRMLANPNDLSTASWQKVADVPVNTKSGPVQITDTPSGNVLPNLILYEAKCSGVFGFTCSTTSKIVENGVRRRVSPPQNVGECIIVATQTGNAIDVRVTGLPSEVNRVTIRKDHVNNSQGSRNFRSHEIVPTKDDQRDFAIVDSNTSAYIFRDVNVSDRALYRYYAQLDWIDRPRSLSVSDAYAEYRRLPDKQIVSFAENVMTGVDSSGQYTVSFDLGANFANEGIDELYRLLSETGVGSLFVEELRKDRSLISNLLTYEVSRKNIRTGDTIVWPLKSIGKFTDNFESRRTARGGSERLSELDLRGGATYLYTARLLIINPEIFFRETLTRIPASTRQTISNTDPNFIDVSSRKWAENFAVKPGYIKNPRPGGENFRNAVQGAFTGISYNLTVTVPAVKAVLTPVITHKSTAGMAANVITWGVTGPLDSIYSFQVDIITDRTNQFPLQAVSPSVGTSGRYEIRDTIFVEEIKPVSYAVTIIYTDMSRSKSVLSNELHAGSTIPAVILNQALQRQISNIVPVDPTKVNANTFDSRLIAANASNPLLKGGLTDKNISTVTQQTSFPNLGITKKF